MTTRTLIAAGLLALAVALPAAPSRADEHWHDDHWHGDHGHGDHHAYHDFHGHDFRFFTPFELDLWRRGAWVHDWYGGRYGWWWVADGYWYWYPQPIYPYPTYVPPVPPATVVTAPGAPPPPPTPVMPAPPPPPPPPAPAGQAAPQYWYYCDGARAYYPTVSACDTPWRPVPAQ